ncbi:hypothetical protein F030043B2_26360 [Bacteroides fragilis]|jgi:hypothetical protein
MYFKLVESLDLKAESSSLLTFDFQLLTEEQGAMGYKSKVTRSYTLVIPYS